MEIDGNETPAPQLSHVFVS